MLRAAMLRAAQPLVARAQRKPDGSVLWCRAVRPEGHAGRALVHVKDGLKTRMASRQGWPQDKDCRAGNKLARLANGRANNRSQQGWRKANKHPRLAVCNVALKSRGCAPGSQ